MICFVASESNYLNGLIFDPENDFSYMYLIRYGTSIENINSIKSTVSSDKTYCLICLSQEKYITLTSKYSYTYGCLIFNFASQMWSKFNNVLENGYGDKFDFEVYYLKNNEYLVYAPKTSDKYHLYTFDNTFQIINEYEGNKCYNIYEKDYSNEKYSSTIIFNNNQYLFISSQQLNGVDSFTINEIPDDYIYASLFDGFELNQNLSIIYKNKTISTIISTSKAIIPSTIVNPSTIITTYPYINPTSIIIINSSNPSIDSIITTYIESALISTTIDPELKTSTSLIIPTTIQEVNSFIISSSTIPLIPISSSTNIINTQSPTTIIQPLTNNIQAPTTIIQSITTIALSQTNVMDAYNNFDILFYYVGEILYGKINATKEYIEVEIDKIINLIEIGQKYKIEGEDYNITISPIDDINYFNTYINFLECEDILRKKYNLSDEEILTIIQIEIDKMKENSLTNQVEYAVYDEERNKLNLSFCEDIEIKINYYIKNNSLLNISKISHYSNLGIDILNIKHSFFNDICYPFSNTNSDLILKDRVTDIYQNFSLCDNNCDYDKIDIQNMTIACTCSVKTEINIKVEPPVFGEIVKDTFKDSNFGVIKCSQLVFSFKNKSHNIGFIILSIYIIINILLFTYYFIRGIRSIKIFIFKEIEKYNFTLIVAQPIKRQSKLLNKKNSLYSSHNSKNILSSNKTLLFLNKSNKKNSLLKNNIDDKNSKNQINNIMIINKINNKNILKVNKHNSFRSNKIKIKNDSKKKEILYFYLYY